MAEVEAADRSRLVAEAQQLRTSGALGRSDLLVRLFDFLLQRSLEGRVPKEVEVAQEVFGKGADFDMMQDASVRVYIHRLRRKIDDAYAGKTGERLLIPLGEYRLTMSGAAAVEPGSIEAPVSPEEKRRWSVGHSLWIALALLLLVNIAGWAAVLLNRPTDPFAAVADTQFWKSMTDSSRPAFIVAGDYYIFGEAPDTMEVTRLIRAFSINSREDLDQYLMSHPDQSGRFVDVDLHYLPVSAASAVGDIVPLLNAARGDKARRARVISGSQLTPDLLKTANILYVGLFSGLGLLRDPLFAASGFAVGASYDELVDRKTNKHYLSDWAEVTDNRTPRRDYGYLASFPGPSGNRILIVAGTRDAAAMQAAEVATDGDQLRRIDQQTGNTRSFEALFEVRTMGNLNLGSTLVLARRIKVKGLWQLDHPPQTFPDEASSPGQARMP